MAWCVNTTRLPLLAVDAPKAKELEQAGKAMRDPFGDGRWIRQACASAPRLRPAPLAPRPLAAAATPQRRNAATLQRRHARLTRAAPHAPRRYTPNRKEPQLSEARIGELNGELQRRLARDAEASLLSGACSGRGLLTPTMPWKPKGPNRKVHPNPNQPLYLTLT